MRLVGYCLLLTMMGCSMAPEYARPAMELGEGWRQGAAEAMPVEAQWWRRFGNRELDGLVELALARNYDLQASLERVEQARAAVRVAGSSLFPQVSGSASASRSDSNSAPADNSYRAGVNLDYEVDLWGRNRAGVTAAEARMEASRFDYEALALIVASDVAGIYFDLLGYQGRLDVAEANLQAAEEILTISEARFREGAVSGLEVAQQASVVASSRVQIAALRQQAEASIHALAVLTGQPPSQIEITGGGLAQVTLPHVAASLPSQLLEQRPDIRRAEASLMAANADIGAARAAFFPSVMLSANIAALGSPAGVAGAVASSLLAPIFQGGRLEGALEQTEARQRELVQQYQASILAALREVEDAMAARRAAEERRSQLQLAADAAGEAYAIGRARYEAGAEDYQTLLDVQRSRLQAEDALIQAQAGQLFAAVALYKALGGGAEPPKE